MKVLYVEWVDASSNSGWEKASDIVGIHRCRSVGFLVKEDKTQVVLAACVSGDECNANIAIPKEWIKKRKVIKL